MAKKKRKYMHHAGKNKQAIRLIDIEHKSWIDKIHHLWGGSGFGAYKTKPKK